MIYRVEFEVSDNEHSPDWHAKDIEANSEDEAIEILIRTEKAVYDYFVHEPVSEE